MAMQVEPRPALGNFQRSALHLCVKRGEGFASDGGGEIVETVLMGGLLVCVRETRTVRNLRLC